MDNRNLLIIKASAGSGKTFMLAKLFIQHLLFEKVAGSDHFTPRKRSQSNALNAHRKLLAITFTNKATDEMKRRIVTELYKLSLPNGQSEYMQDLIDCTEPKVSQEEVRSLAQLALEDLLYDYSYFNVSTIDSFFQTILRNFARELDCDYNYDIQIDDDYATRVAVHNFLLSLGKTTQRGETEVDKWVKDIQQQQLQENKNEWKFFDDKKGLYPFAKKLNEEAFRKRLDQLREFLPFNNGTCDLSQMHEFKKFIQQVKKHYEQQLIKKEPQQLDDNTLPTQFQGVIKKYGLEELLYGGRALDSLYKQSDYTTLNPKNVWFTRRDEEFFNGVFRNNAIVTPQAQESIIAVRRKIIAAFSAWNFFKELDKDLGQIGLLGMIDHFLTQFRHETNSIMLGDTNDMIATVLKSGVPFVYERIGATIDHYMIDEFQDTSAKQYENFKQLFAESLSNGHFNLIIGDAKQSIYRFRNADITVFREKVTQDFSNDYATMPLDTNWRSSATIIDFNNHLFKYLANRFDNNPDVQATYDNIEQNKPQNIDSKVPGYVRIINSTIGQDPETLDKDKVLSMLPHYLLQLHKRFKRWSQIGILVNTRNEGNQIIETILTHNQQHSTNKDQQIGIVSEDSLKLSNSPQVKRIIALLRFINITPHVTIDDKTDATATNDDNQELYKRLNNKRLSTQRLYNTIGAFSQKVAAQPNCKNLGSLLVECLNELSDRTGDENEVYLQRADQLLPDANNQSATLISIVETLIQHLNCDDQETAFLLAFQDFVTDFCNKHGGGSICEFLKYWDEHQDSLTISSSADSDAINVMTIHKAKGLEFDCVILPFANWEIEKEKEKDFHYWLSDPDEVLYPAIEKLLDSTPLQNEMPNSRPPLIRISKKWAQQLALLDESSPLNQYIKKDQTDQLIDNLNKTYVAMTRPRVELHIFTPSKSNNNSDKPNIGQLLDQFAQQHLNDEIYQFKQGVTITDIDGNDITMDNWYEIGEVQTVEPKSEKAQNTNSENLGNYPVSNIPPTIQVRLPEESPIGQDAGNRLHAIMARITTIEDLDFAMRWAHKRQLVSSALSDNCNEETMQRINEAIRQVPEIKPWFEIDNQVYLERTISHTNGINSRPDRVVMMPNGHIAVIDYKSEHFTDSNRQAKHAAQVQGYMNILKSIFPQNPIIGRIWYVNQQRVIDNEQKLVWEKT